MIQVNNSVRRPAPAHPVTETNGPEVWSQWCGRKLAVFAILGFL